MKTSNDIQNEIDNILIAHQNQILDAEAISKIRSLLEEYYIIVFDEGKERGIETVRANPGDYIEPPERNEGND